jgi:hypothetical protein
MSAKPKSGLFALLGIIVFGFGALGAVRLFGPKPTPTASNGPQIASNTTPANATATRTGAAQLENVVKFEDRILDPFQRAWQTAQGPAPAGSTPVPEDNESPIPTAPTRPAPMGGEFQPLIITPQGGSEPAPNQPETSNPEANPEKPEATATPIRVRVTGIVGTANNLRVFISVDGNRPQAIAAGGSLGEITVTQVTPDTVTLSRNGKTVTLTIGTQKEL